MTDKNDDTQTEEIDCLEAIDNLYAYLDGELDDPDTIRKFENHLDHCRSCYTRHELESRLSERLRTAAKAKVPEALRDRLRDLIDKS